MMTLALIIAAVFGLVQLKRMVVRKVNRAKEIVEHAVSYTYDEGSPVARVALRVGLWLAKAITRQMVPA